MGARLHPANRKINQNDKHLRRAFKIWIMQNLQSFVFSLGQFYRNPISSFLTASVIGIALALPAGFYLSLENARLVTSNWGNSVQITAFLKFDIDDDKAASLSKYLSEKNEIEAVQFVSRDLALEEYRHTSGYAEAIDALDENPLPSLLLIRPKFTSLANGQDDQLIEMLQSLPEVELAQYDQLWVKRLNSIIEIVQRTIIILSVFLALAVLLIIGNTIRMAIYNRRSEIEIIKLFGATDAFVRRPFLYSGFWYGLSGGLLAWLLISLSLFLLEQPVSQLAHLYSSAYKLIGLGAKNTLILLATGVLLGIAGSWISVRRHLKTIELS